MGMFRCVGLGVGQLHETRVVEQLEQMGATETEMIPRRILSSLIPFAMDLKCSCYCFVLETQEEAATAYDIAAIRYRGENAVTNFDISNYIAREEILPAPASPPPAPPELVIGRKSISVGGIMLPKKEEEGKDDKGAVLPPPLPPSPPPLLAPLPPKQEPQQYQVQEMMKPQVNPQDVPPMMETHSMMPMMDGTNDHHHDEHGHDPWDQYLHAGFNSLPIPDFFFMDPKPAELPNVFDDISFDQDIDKLFEGGPDDMSFMFDKSSATNEVEADVPTSIEEKKANNKDRSCSPPTSISSDSSTTTKAF
ncbi:hypothetical protein RJ641_036947 [Dillenia turbinata]|uniref:AP2/ERF domain-containing protein n=1 Tax=Dillenia turbinata TaxID=194707 RepID=A0AAN8ZHF3_9MAGN